MYIFLPLHESEYAYGYLVFKDAIDKLYDHYLHSYQNRLGVALDKFRHALTLDEINKRLFDLMRRDALTNVNNRMAFEDKTNYLQSMINSDPEVKFALAMFDVNSLKLINDSQGHEAGDEYLLRTCHLICDVFKHSPVYRMGGDEFIAVLTGEDYDNRDELVAQLNSRLSPYSKTLPLPDDYVSIACGLAVYGSGKDNSVIDVLKRADEEMYKDKTAKKSVVS
jgi:diguanylate cyclase (GGDEF)-like protein